MLCVLCDLCGLKLVFLEDMGFGFSHRDHKEHREGKGIFYFPDSCFVFSVIFVVENSSNRVFFDFELIRPEVDEQPVPESRRFQVAQDLGDMLRS